MFNKPKKVRMQSGLVEDDFKEKKEFDDITIDDRLRGFTRGVVREFDIIQSPNYTRKGITPKVLVIHWTGGSYESCVNWMLNPQSKVSAHFIVDKYGERITQMCDPKYKAWHAGYSSLKGYGDNVNNFSIGVEIEGPPSKTKDKWWYASCMKTIGELVDYLRSEEIHLEGVVDHSTISPKRKVDVLAHQKPEDNFPWSQIIKYTGLTDLATEENRQHALRYLFCKGLI